MSIGNFLRVFLVQTDQPLALQLQGKPPQFRQYSVTKCTACLALVLEEDAEGHAKYHAREAQSHWYGGRPIPAEPTW